MTASRAAVPARARPGSVHGDDEVVGSVAALKVRPVDTAHGAVTGFIDYKQATTTNLSNLVSTEFTVLE